MAPPRLCAVGLDVGGTKTAGGLVDLDTGRLLTRRAFPTLPGRGGAAVLQDALRLAEQLLAEAQAQAWPVAGLGVSLCELVDMDGNVTSGHAVDWLNLPVRAEFSRLAPAVVEADVRAHALAEATWGAGQPHRQFVFVTAGTGISSCLVLDGRPHAGARGNALVLASASTTLPCPACGNTHWPALEDFASGPALVLRYNALGRPPAANAEEVMAVAAGGDTAAQALIQSAGQALGAQPGLARQCFRPRNHHRGRRVGIGRRPVLGQPGCGCAGAYLVRDQPHAADCASQPGPRCGRSGRGTGRRAGAPYVGSTVAWRAWRPTVINETFSLTPGQIDAFATSGYLSLPAITTPEEVAGLCDLYDRLFATRAGRDQGDHLDLSGTDEDGVPAVLPQILNPSKYAPELAHTVFRANAEVIARQLLGPSGRVSRRPCHPQGAAVGGAHALASGRGLLGPPPGLFGAEHLDPTAGGHARKWLHAVCAGHAPAGGAASSSHRQ